nr:MAG: hypothetical protein [Helarchaeota virus Nidhogg Meg22_1012]URC17328.1 MAG: hypothetical protein [Helarchaeota virus Nidhogg Meg22_1214]
MPPLTEDEKNLLFISPNAGSEINYMVLWYSLKLHLINHGEDLDQKTKVMMIKKMDMMEIKEALK